jgi:hypothetical protein
MKMSYKLFNEARLKNEDAKFLAQIGGGQIKNEASQKKLLSIWHNYNAEMKKEATVAADVAAYQGILISLLRRTMPNLVGTQLIGNQVQATPDALIFCQRAYYGDDTTTGVETWNGTRPDVTRSGTALGSGLATSVAEALGTQVVDATSASTTAPVIEFPSWGKMSTKIDKILVTAKTRALKANMTLEFIEDLKNVHGVDGEAMVAEMLQGEIISEIDYEILAFIVSQAKVGAAIDVATLPGQWDGHKYSALARRIQNQANIVGQETRRGVANWLVTTPDVATALSSTDKMSVDHNYFEGGRSDVNVTGLTYVGRLNTGLDVYQDPYATPGTNWGVVGYKGSDIDAGAFYSVYSPLQLIKGQSEDGLQPKLGVKTRYGLVHNPYASGLAGGNQYFRQFAINNLG